MAISLQGERKLWVRGKEETPLEQRERNLYVSNPSFFVHSVEYPKCEWKDAVVAIQARFLLTCEEFVALDKARVSHREAWLQLKGIIEKELEQGGLCLPSLAQVQLKEQEMMASNEKEKEKERKQEIPLHELVRKAKLKRRGAKNKHST